MTLTETRLPLAHFVGRADENHRKLHTFCEEDRAKLLPKTVRTAKMQATQRGTTATVTDADLADTFAGGGGGGVVPTLRWWCGPTGPLP